MPLDPPSYTSNPYLPFVSFKAKTGSTINFGNPDNHRPQWLMSFQIEMILDDCGTWEIVLFDTKYDEIESLLVSEFQNGVTLQFGYQPGVGALVSPEFDGTILEYIPEFTLGGQKLTLRGNFEDHTTGTAISAAHTWPTCPPEAKAFVDKYPDDKPDMTIADIVKAIIKKNGWKEGSILETELAKDPNQSLITTDPAPHKYLQPAGMSDLNFIRTVLVPNAVASKDPKQTGYQWFFNPTTKELDFKPYSTTDEATVETFVFAQDKNSEILQFEPSITALWAVLCAKNDARTIEPNTGAVANSPVETPETSTRYDSGKKCLSPTLQAADQLKGEHASGVIFGLPVNNVGQLAVNNKSAWSSLYNKSYAHARLIIIGHPTKYVPMKNVDLKILTPPPDQRLHFLSGNWKIQSVVHNIDAGGFTTTMELDQNSGSEGPVDTSTIGVQGRDGD